MFGLILAVCTHLERRFRGKRINVSHTPFDTHEKSLDLCGFERVESVTFLPLFPLSLGGFDFLHASGAVRAVFSPVGFGDNGRAADSAPFLAPPVQEGCGQLPVKGQDSHTEPAAHEGKGKTRQSRWRWQGLSV